jgi:hypothetical protein
MSVCVSRFHKKKICLVGITTELSSSIVKGEGGGRGRVEGEEGGEVR